MSLTHIDDYERLISDVSKRILEIMMDDDRLKHSDIVQTSFGRLMCQEFTSLRERVYRLSEKIAGVPYGSLKSLELEVLTKKITKLEREIEELRSNPEKLLRLSIDNFKLN
jgi:polyhydroxyalkanoate synthesis regulator phasin